MGFDRDILNFIDEYVKAISESSAAVFAGAGLSIPAGAVNWKELLRAPASRLGLSVDRESDLVAIAQYIYNDSNTRTPLTELINDFFNKSGQITRNHNLIVNLPIKTVWTTNYDRFIEQAFLESGKTPDVKKRVIDLSSIRSNRDAVVYKMHGDVDLAQDAILIKDDYEMYDTKNQMFSIALKGDLVSKTFLFVGFSFEDPNLEHILSKIRILVDGHTRTHYCFIKRVKEADYKETEEFQYDKIKQELKCADLKRYSIKPLLIDEYNEITEILEMISERYNRRNILISGSAYSYEDFEIKGIKAQDFIHDLSKALSKCGFKIATGFGLGVGSGVINGVLERMSEENSKNIDNYLLMRPFPQYAKEGENLEKLWHSYRENLLQECGIAIFIFGNKNDPEKGMINAEGVEKEFEIAYANNVKVIPIGVTGYASKLLFERLMVDYEEFYPEFPRLKDDFIKLNEKGIDHEEVIRTILKIVTSIRGGT
ncbi:SIR2 family protein [Exiguobacterium artemiae]|uniref:SIR2 family protein n=1 Tax=Exiguobacterium artemiae TaxID=340145 RepID=UPI00047CC715|nr:SIR2 family protein [Exiguobacterium sibiricum]